MSPASPLPLGEGQSEGPSDGSHSLDVQRFGQSEPLEVRASEVITFPKGLVGLEHLSQFVLVEDERVVPCRWLQSLEEPALAFLVVDPGLVHPAYDPDLPAGERWVIITLRQQPEASTANLLAPVVIDPQSRTGQQLVLHESGFSLRHPIQVPPADPRLEG